MNSRNSHEMQYYSPPLNYLSNHLHTDNQQGSTTSIVQLVYDLMTTFINQGVIGKLSAVPDRPPVQTEEYSVDTSRYIGRDHREINNSHLIVTPGTCQFLQYTTVSGISTCKSVFKVKSSSYHYRLFQDTDSVSR